MPITIPKLEIKKERLERESTQCWQRRTGVWKEKQTKPTVEKQKKKEREREIRKQKTDNIKIALYY
jgi:hypothetical protein